MRTAVTDCQPSLAGLPVYTLPLAQVPWRLSVLASQVTRFPYRPLADLVRQVRPSPLAPRPSHPTLYHATEHLLPRLPGPTVLTVHDLIFEHYPEHHTRRNMLYLRTAMPLFVRAATAIIAVSAHTRRDLCELYGVPATKIHVVYEGIDAAFAPSPPAEVERVRGQYSPDRPYLLMVGTLEPRKNHATALAALARLKAAGFPHRLVIVGGKGWLFEPVAAVGGRAGLGGRRRLYGVCAGSRSAAAVQRGSLCPAAESIRRLWFSSAGGHGLRRPGRLQQREQPA